MFDRQGRLEQSRDPSGGLRMADVTLDGSDEQWLICWPGCCEEGSRATNLGRISGLSTCPMALQKKEVSADFASCHLADLREEMGVSRR